MNDKKPVWRNCTAFPRVGMVFQRGLFPHLSIIEPDAGAVRSAETR
ncbi:hypothetical protein KCP78_01995 [Salmonella enterica subsp. enterica]|nr:hypothetical protein KCP78_01995 [Salmonella enterica subsp. enterica]